MMNMIPDRDEHGNFETIIKIQEESRDPAKQTGHNYQAKSLDFEITQAGMQQKDFTFPYPIALFSAEWVNEDNYTGDCFKVLIAPDTPVGVLTQAHSINDTTLQVNDTVVANAKVGYEIKLGSFECGRVIAVDEGALTITVENGIDLAYPALEPVLMTVVMVDGIRLSGKGRFELGKDVIGGSFIPGGKPIRVLYENNQGDTVDKIFSTVIEYKY
jgi:hypothetical protein